MNQKYYYLHTVRVNGIDLPSGDISEREFALQEAAKAVKERKRVEFLLYDHSRHVKAYSWTETLCYFTVEYFEYDGNSFFNFIDPDYLGCLDVNGWMPEEREIRVDRFVVFGDKDVIKRSVDDIEIAKQLVQDGFAVCAMTVSVFKPSFDALFDESPFNFTFTTSKIVQFLSDEQFVTNTGMKFKIKK